MVPASYGGALTAYNAASMAYRMAKKRKYVQNMQRGAKAAKFMWKHRGKFIKFAKAVKKRRASRRIHRGARNPSKAHQTLITQGAGTALSYRTLTISNFPWPDFSTTADIGERNRNHMYLKGIKICRQFYIEDVATVTNDYVVTWCVLQLKSGNNPNSANIQDQFFRANDDPSTRSIPFISAGAGSAFDPSYLCHPLNPNHNFRIITRRSRVLRDIATGDGSKRDKWNIEYYMPVRKNFTFDTSSDLVPNQPIFECFWVHAATPRSHPADPTAWANTIFTWNRHVVYFR